MLYEFSSLNWLAKSGEDLLSVGRQIINLEEIVSFNLSNIKWVWVIVGVVVAMLVAYGSSICVVTIYASVLAFQAQGTPDQALINEYANNNAGIITAVFVIVGTFLGGLLAGRKAKEDAAQNGLVVGIITALIMLVMGIIGGINLWVIVSVLLALVGGWLGGRMAAR